MKVLKWIFIILGAIIALILIYSATQPNKVVVEESIVINAPANQVYAEIVNFPNFLKLTV